MTEADPRTVITLSGVAGLLNDFFERVPQIEYRTPFVWWHRSKANHAISLPMPQPVGFLSGGDRAPYWHQEQILHWFGQWQELSVRECQEAGDSVRGGRFKPSAYRVAS